MNIFILVFILSSFCSTINAAPRQIEEEPACTVVGNMLVDQDLDVSGTIDADSIVTETLEVTDTLEVTNTATFGCDIEVGCNILMHNSSSPAIGNIFKDGNSFMHNFGNSSTFLGENAGNFITVPSQGSSNTGIGTNALNAATTAIGNVAVGNDALRNLSSGTENVAVGAGAGSIMNLALRQTAVGYKALGLYTSGGFEGNTAVGANALSGLANGIRNIAIGDLAGFNYIGNESDNIIIGSSLGNTGDNGTIRIGRNITQTANYQAGIFGATVNDIPSMTNVVIDNQGKLAVLPSSERVKRDIQPINQSMLDKFMLLTPVSFYFKNDASNTLQFGLIAEQAHDVMPEVVLYDQDGNPVSIKQHVLYALLLKQVQLQELKINQLEADIVTLKNEFLRKKQKATTA